MTIQVPRDFHKKIHMQRSSPPSSSSLCNASLCNSNSSSLQLLPHLFQDFPFTSAAISAPQSEFASNTSTFANTRIDWKETPKAHVFKADLPGLKKEEVKVEIEEGRVLQISGERSKEKEEKDDTWHRPDRSRGKFLRRFRLLENAKPDQVKANMENRVLTVTLPKEAVKKPDVKAIEISG